MAQHFELVYLPHRHYKQRLMPLLLQLTQLSTRGALSNNCHAQEPCIGQLKMSVSADHMSA